jgi:hypothetical protein
LDVHWHAEAPCPALGNRCRSGGIEGDNVSKWAPRPIKMMGNSAIFVVIGMPSPVHTENVIRV